MHALCREWMRNRNKSKLEKLVFTEDGAALVADVEANGDVTESPGLEILEVSTYRPEFDLQQLSGLQGLTESFEDIDGVTERPGNGLLETDLQQLLAELSKDRFKAPANPWDIRTAAEMFRNRHNNNENKINVKEVRSFFLNLYTLIKFEYRLSF